MTTAARNDRMTARYSAMVARAMRDAHARLLPSGRGCYELPSGRGCCVLPSGGGCYHDEHEHGYEHGHGHGHGHEHEHEHERARVHGPRLVRRLLRLLVLPLCCSAAGAARVAAALHGLRKEARVHGSRPRLCIHGSRSRSSLRPRLTASAWAATARMITEQPTPAPHGQRVGSHSAHDYGAAYARASRPARGRPQRAARHLAARHRALCVKSLAAPPHRSPSRRSSLHALVTAPFTTVASSMRMRYTARAAAAAVKERPWRYGA